MKVEQEKYELFIEAKKKEDAMLARFASLSVSGSDRGRVLW